MYKTQKKEQFSVAYVKALAAPLGFNPGKFDVDDDSVDIIFSAKYPIDSIKRNPQLNLQLKCTKIIPNKDGYLHFPLPIKNYNELKGTNVSNPSYLIVVRVPENENDWIECNDYELVMRYSAFWFSLKDYEDVDNKDNITILIPVTQIFNKIKFQELMDLASKGLSL